MNLIVSSDSEDETIDGFDTLIDNPNKKLHCTEEVKYELKEETK